MNNFFIVLKILLSAFISCSVLAIYLMSIAIASSSHNISMTDRNDAVRNGYIAFILGPILILCIWLPWKKWFSKQ